MMHFLPSTHTIQEDMIDYIEALTYIVFRARRASWALGTRRTLLAVDCAPPPPAWQRADACATKWCIVENTGKAGGVGRFLLQRGRKP